MVVGLWLFVMPYLVYWLTRFYFWSGHSVAFGPPSSGHAGTPTLALGAGGGPASITGGLVQTEFRRFAEFDSWHDWYMFSVSNSTVVPVFSYTGVIDGATNSVLALYTIVHICLRIGVELLRVTLGISITDSRFIGLTEATMEFCTKSAEGMVITLISIVVFMAVFMLRDWVLTNAPVDDDFADEVDEHIDQAPGADAHDAVDNRQPGEAPEVAQQLRQVEGRPMVPEDPQHRPL
ncbi:hypothetical protein LPJ61_005947, partial [Coemansia biformis]